MDKLKMQSLDVIGSNIQKIAQLFPNCVTERLGKNGKSELAIDFEKLQAELSNDIIIEDEERYQFTWPDKRKAVREANIQTTSTLRPCRDESVNFDNTQNLYIEGDNLEVLKVLRETYLGKVKMIYIDPPYNTGNDFVYNDDFAQGKGEFEQASGLFDEEGNQTIDPMQRNTESNGRFHTDWLNMIYPRLKVARDLLTDDGVIFISIDSVEVSNLRKICDEIWGKDNMLGHVVRRAKTTSFRGNYFAPRVDYLLAYAKNISNVEKFKGEVDTEQYSKIETEGPRKGERYGDDTAFYLSTLQARPNQRYFIKCPDGELVIPPGETLPKEKIDGEKVLPHNNDGVWRWEVGSYFEKKHMLSFKKTKTSPLLNQNGEKAHWNIYTKIYLNDKLVDANIPEELFLDFINRQSTKELEMLNIPFDFAKPISLIKYVVKIINNNDDAIILDFFSGSATTAHAVMKLNAEDGGNRKFIMVQLPEMTDEKSEAYKAGYKNICEIGKERIRRAGKKVKEEAGLQGQNLDTGFRVLKLDSSNMEEVYYTPQEFSMGSLFNENVKADRSNEDLLFQVMLDLGIELSAKIESKQIAGKQVHIVDEGYLVACFDRDVNESTIIEIAKQQPVYFVMRDASAANDNVIDNFEQIFRHYSPDTSCRII